MIYSPHTYIILNYYMDYTINNQIFIPTNLNYIIMLLCSPSPLLFTYLNTKESCIIHLFTLHL